MKMDHQRIEDLRKSLRVEQRGSLLVVIDECLEIMESMEKRLRYMEKANEETD